MGHLRKEPRQQDHGPARRHGPHGLRKGMLVVALLMIVGGSITMWTNYSIGADQVAKNAEAERYVVPAEANWYAPAK